MTLLLFDDDPKHNQPINRIDLSPYYHRTGDMWHVRLTGNVWGRIYALQADGPQAPMEGHRFDGDQFLVDPYAPLLVGGQGWDEGTDQPRPRCVMADHVFDWQDDTPPRHPWSNTIIYETHVRGLSYHPSSGAQHPGQYLGVVDKIPYLKNLGISALELMPVQAFLPSQLDQVSPMSDKPLRDYWGYNPVGLFAPMAGYADARTLDAPLAAFKTMVRELHKASIEVILDVVFNHTVEGNEDGPTLSFRGLDNAIYYILAPDKRYYLDYTGCGNTLNCNHPVVRGMIVDCLRHWVIHFHVDGFRFDLASVLGRDATGNLLPNPPILEQISEDPILREVKLIAEAWDSAGAFQVGRFPGQRWAEWNCHYRDDVRRFWRGDGGMTGRFASRLCGSADLYERDVQSPLKSINFVACHDGFTLNDLVSFATKHNEANGEDNRDGMNENYSVKNMLTTLFVSRGVPMLLGGDEFRRTQGGNNNAYCQDNETSWYDWTMANEHADLVRFVRRLIAFRNAHPVLSAEHFYTASQIVWFSADGLPPDWDGSGGRIGCLIHEETDRSMCLLFNATRDVCCFVLPASQAGAWHVAVDTSKEAPDDAPDTGKEPNLDSRHEIYLEGRTTVALIFRPVRPDGSPSERRA